MTMLEPASAGFEGNRAIDRPAGRFSDGYPPYNIERIAKDGVADMLRITLAVAGFTRDQRNPHLKTIG
jgi:HSP20 family molecular chaperone IbpA